MPNPKVGTVTPDVATAVKNAKAGQVQYRTDKAGIIHATIGRASFGVEQLQTNLAALVDALNKARPTASKGVRSEEHTSELPSLMRISYAVFCLKHKTIQTNNITLHT